MTLPTETKQWLLVKKPTDSVQLSGPDATFKLVTTPLPSLEDGQILVKSLYFSNDPSQRGMINPNWKEERLYAKPPKEGDVMMAYGISEVVASRAEHIAVGSFVRASAGWTEYAVVPASAVQAVQAVGDLSITHFLGAFGATGLTAYYGLLDVVNTRPEDSVVISGAAGATGSMAVQIAKRLVGCKRVVGIAGTDEKCRWVESLGADVCLNYKSANFYQELEKATEGFVDVYFDNVGGEILNFMLTRMGQNGRVAACGGISGYDKGKSEGVTNWMDIVTMRLQIKGFIVLDAGAKLLEYTKVLLQGYKDGKITITKDAETVVPTKFEEIPETWTMLFDGRNTGKLVTKLV